MTTKILEFVQANLDSILGIVGMVLAWIVSRPWSQAKKAEARSFINSNNLQAVELLATSVASRVYTDTVRNLRGTTAWTDDMKRKVLNDAVEILKAEVKEHGIEIAQAVLPGLMQRAVLALKPKVS